MRRYLTSAMVAFGVAAMFAVNTGAQTTETKTTVKTEDGKTVNYTGCVQSGIATQTFVLQNAIPVARTETTGTSGTMTTTTYALLPDTKVELQQHLGHKVEVTAVLVPAGKGDTKVETKTKTEGTEQKTKAEIERGPLPQLKVISVKELAESCS